MLIFPAIDIKDGICVRLKKGDFATAEKVAEDPLCTALSFHAAGSEWIHMVDLDGAKLGAPVNTEIFETVAKQSGLKVQVGGGIRAMETVEQYLDLGISRIILGSAAVKNPPFLKAALNTYGEKIAVGIDSRNRRAACEGWTDTHEIEFTELAKRVEAEGCRTIIFTDISKDGLLAGPNFQELAEIGEAVTCDIIASGGVTTLEDIKALRKMNLYGAICGRALYSGHLDLKSAISAAI